MKYEQGKTQVPGKQASPGRVGRDFRCCPESRTKSELISRCLRMRSHKTAAGRLRPGLGVADGAGNVICSDVRWSEKLYGDWTTAWGGPV